MFLPEVGTLPLQSWNATPTFMTVVIFMMQGVVTPAIIFSTVMSVGVANLLGSFVIVGLQ